MNDKEKHNAYMRKYFKERVKKEPWFMHYNSARGRCNNRKRNWFKRGIKLILTLSEIKTIWFRDKAYLLKKASLDRLDNNKNYTFENCRFIEHSENSRQGNLGNRIKRGMYKKNVSKQALVMRRRREAEYRKEI